MNYIFFIKNHNFVNNYTLKAWAPTHIIFEVKGEGVMKNFELHKIIKANICYVKLLNCLLCLICNINIHNI